ncbi:MAG: hypothetical protein PVJ02_08370 [Gemmatimonadota bacterium]|jgi:hypothetical protein
MGRWERREDLKNLTLIGASAWAAVLATGGLLLANRMSTPQAAPPHRPTRVTVATYSFGGAVPLSGSDRLFGRVRTVDGRELVGFIRWDRNEGSWTDVLDAIKVSDGHESQSGIRFGQIQRIRVDGSRRALLTLRSGARVEMSARATDLGQGLRALVVAGPDGGSSEMRWSDLDAVEFLPAPEGERPAEGRLYGTLTTRSGARFTGRVTWDVDEIYTTDVLDGDRDGRRVKIPFGAIQRIERHGSRAAHVVLTSGDALTLSGTNDVNDENGGISVSDPSLGQVMVPWDDFVEVTFAEAPQDADRVTFDGGRPIVGTVVTEGGERLTGQVRWDNDEASTWEMLDGRSGGADFEIEFAQIRRIAKADAGARVTLKDGRSFQLTGSNDVNRENRGIVVDTGDGIRKVRWEDFRELLLGD